MQATDGRVKIGRSADPKQRRRNLQSAGGRKVAILLVLANRGHEELGILHALAAYRGFGEWFPFQKGLEEAICQVIGVAISLPYPVTRAQQDTKDKAEQAAIIAKILATAAKKSRLAKRNRAAAR